MPAATIHYQLQKAFLRFKITTQKEPIFGFIMSLKYLCTNWQLLELIGKLLILLAICFQLLIIGNANTKSVEIDRIDSQNYYYLNSSNYRYLVHLVEDQGLEIQLAILRNQRLILMNQRMANIDFGENKEAILETENTIRELTAETVGIQDLIRKLRSNVKEKLLGASDAHESSRDLSKKIEATRSKNNLDLQFLNYVFLILFAIGSGITLYARRLEMLVDKHPINLPDQEPTSIIAASEQP